MATKDEWIEWLADLSQREADPSRYESELTFEVRHIKELEGGAREDPRIQNTLSKLRRRVAALKASPPTPDETMEWLYNLRDGFKRVRGRRRLWHQATAHLKVVEKRIEEIAGTPWERATAAARVFARAVLANPEIISDEMLLAEVERRGLLRRS